jgi:hypothetical protein
VVTTPGLSLTDVRPFRERRGAALVAGLSEAVQGFPALPDVPEELDAITALFPGKRLQDGQFVADNLRRELAAEPYSLVHVATHARFEREARDSFLLTYDKRMSLSELEALLATTRGRAESVELLSLSACETAVGDDRAALGLAGVAVKAGARSAVATLWRVSDEATALAATRFLSPAGRPGGTRQGPRAAPRPTQSHEGMAFPPSGFLGALPADRQLALKRYRGTSIIAVGAGLPAMDSVRFRNGTLDQSRASPLLQLLFHNAGPAASAMDGWRLSGTGRKRRNARPHPGGRRPDS